MLSTDDLAQMTSDLAAVRDDNDVSIVIRRGTSTTLAAQTFRIASGNSGGRADSGTGQESRDTVVMLGASTANVQIDDRFTLTVASAPVLMRVTWVRPDRRVATMAKAEAVE